MTGNKRPFVLMALGVLLLYLGYQQRMFRTPVMYVAALAIYGLVIVNFQTIHDQITSSLHPDKRAKK